MREDFTLEKLKIAERLASLEAEVRESTRASEKILANHNLVLFGNGNGNKGLLIKVDRLEQIEIDRKVKSTSVRTGIIALFVTNLGFVGKAIWDLFHHK